MMNAPWKWPGGTLVLTAGLYLVGRFPAPEGWWLLPWILSLVFIGLPHGALDHEVILRLWTPTPRPTWALAATIAGYLLLAGVVVVGWFWSPLAIFYCFILLTWAHWGLGDLWWSWQRDPAYFTSSFHRFIFTVWRGSMPMFLPLAIDPQLYLQVAQSLCRLFSDSVPDLQWIRDIHIRETVLGVVFALGFIDASLANRRSGTRLLNACEGMCLFCAFIFLPPVVAVGFYFVLWHGLRHVLRLMKMEQLSFAKFVWRSAPATIAAICLLGFLGWNILRHQHNAKFLFVYLALIAALTVPHSVVVAWMDRRDRLY